MFKTIIKILQRLEDKIDPPRSTTIRTSDEAWKAWNSAPSTAEPVPQQPYVGPYPHGLGSCGAIRPGQIVQCDSLGAYSPYFSFDRIKELESKKDETRP